MRDALTWIAAAVVVVLLVANLVLLAVTRGEVGALGVDLRERIDDEAGTTRSGPEVAPSADGGESAGDVVPARPGPETGSSPDPLEAEARAFYGRLLEAGIDDRFDEVSGAVDNAAGRYDATVFGEKIKKLAGIVGGRRNRAKAKEYARVARLLAAEGKLGEGKGSAIDGYKRAIMLDPLNTLYHHALGDCYVSEGEFRKAMIEYGNIVVLAGDEPFGYILRGRVREELGDAAGAIADYEKALDLHPGNVEARERLDAAARKAKGDE